MFECSVHSVKPYTIYLISGDIKHTVIITINENKRQEAFIKNDFLSENYRG